MTYETITEEEPTAHLAERRPKKRSLSLNKYTSPIEAINAWRIRGEWCCGVGLESVSACSDSTYNQPCRIQLQQLKDFVERCEEEWVRVAAQLGERLPLPRSVPVAGRGAGQDE